MSIREEHQKSKEYWDSRAKPWATSNASVSYLTKFYAEWAEKLEDPLLDVGCGSGKFLYRAISNGRVDVYGVDISPKLIEIAREKLQPFLGEETNQRITAMDMLDLSEKFEKGFFQSLIFSGVLQQTMYSGARPVLEQIAQVSAPGAIMYFSTRSIATPPQNGILVKEEKGTYRLPDGAVKTYFGKSDIEELTDGLFVIMELNEKPQTEKISGMPIMNWEGVLRRRKKEPTHRALDTLLNNRAHLLHSFEIKQKSKLQKVCAGTYALVIRQLMQQYEIPTSLLESTEQMLKKYEELSKQ